ncbi:MAG: 3-hydroxyacyl-CoA dehydrogenase NAD-binding domain-containing protein [Ferruginibacter sp.]
MINRICVAGAGTMGSGIAQVAAHAGFQTILFDLQQEILDKAKISIEKNLQYLVDKTKISPEEKKEIFNRIQFVNEHIYCRADIIIEAIVEKLSAKAELFNTLIALNDQEVILATNTSSLSVSALQKEIKSPAQLAGMHFFNPAPVMKLVEIVKGDQTSDETMIVLQDLVKKMGKTAVLCKDAPGFIVNRVARPYYLEAMKLAESGSADFKTIDRVMQSSGFKMGPFKLMDLIGLDINYAVSCLVYEQLNRPPRLRPSVLQEQKVKDGKFGIKKGEGFYLY